MDKLDIHNIYKLTHWGGTIKGVDIEGDVMMTIKPNVRKHVNRIIRRVGTGKARTGMDSWVYQYVVEALRLPEIRWDAGYVYYGRYGQYTRSYRRYITINAQHVDYDDWAEKIERSALLTLPKIMEDTELEFSPGANNEYERIRITWGTESPIHKLANRNKFFNKNLGVMVKEWLGPAYPETPPECPERIRMNINHDGWGDYKT